MHGLNPDPWHCFLGRLYDPCIFYVDHQGEALSPFHSMPQRSYLNEQSDHFCELRPRCFYIHGHVTHPKLPWFGGFPTPCPMRLLPWDCCEPHPLEPNVQQHQKAPKQLWIQVPWSCSWWVLLIPDGAIQLLLELLSSAWLEHKISVDPQGWPPTHLLTAHLRGYTLREAFLPW